jgi:hypothetical protein
LVFYGSLFFPLLKSSNPVRCFDDGDGIMDDVLLVAIHVEGDGSHVGVGEEGDASAANGKPPQEDRKIILLPKKQTKIETIQRNKKGHGGMMFDGDSDDDSEDGAGVEDGGDGNVEEIEDSGNKNAKSLFGEKKKEREMDRLFEELKAYALLISSPLLG